MSLLVELEMFVFILLFDKNAIFWFIATNFINKLQTNIKLTLTKKSFRNKINL